AIPMALDQNVGLGESLMTPMVLIVYHKVPGFSSLKWHRLVHKGESYSPSSPVKIGSMRKQEVVFFHTRSSLISDLTLCLYEPGEELSDDWFNRVIRNPSLLQIRGWKRVGATDLSKASLNLAEPDPCLIRSKGCHSINQSRDRVMLNEKGERNQGEMKLFDRIDMIINWVRAELRVHQ
ncbi:12605_t:CDS:2, partial [Acaulospora morrowiae]